MQVYIPFACANAARRTQTSTKQFYPLAGESDTLQYCTVHPQSGCCRYTCWHPNYSDIQHHQLASRSKGQSAASMKAMGSMAECLSRNLKAAELRCVLCLVLRAPRLRFSRVKRLPVISAMLAIAHAAEHRARKRVIGRAPVVAQASVHTSKAFLSPQPCRSPSECTAHG